MLSELGAMKVNEPEDWAACIRDAMERMGGNITRAALALGVSSRQLHRWLDEEQFSDIQRQKAGRPPGTHSDRTLGDDEMAMLEKLAKIMNSSKRIRVAG